MPQVDKNLLLSIAVVLAAVSGVFLFLALTFRKRVKGNWQKFRGKQQWPAAQSNRLQGRETEIQRVLRADFQKKRLMNQSEYQLFTQLEVLFRQRPLGFRLFPQVQLGGLVASDDREAFLAIMNKCCDFVIVSRSGEPAAVIEYQGHGHFQGNSAQRDELKRLALKKAGVPTIEVMPNYVWEDVANDIRRYTGI